MTGEMPLIDKQPSFFDTIFSITSCVFGSMITISAFVGKAQLHDFVSVTFLPMVPLIVVGYLSLKRYYDELLI